MTATRRVGILGGTFDPIHTGHIALASAAQARLNLSRVVLVPSHIPPHRPQPRASGFHRFAMVALAVAGRHGWQVSDMELTVAGPSYTTDTIRQFHQQGYDASELFFIIGADAFAEIATWRDYPGLLDRTHFAVISRPGDRAIDLPQRLPQLAHRMRGGDAEGQAGRGLVRTGEEPVLNRSVIFLIDATTPDVSATAIRQRCADGDSIQGLVDTRVQQHIEQHELYRSFGAGRGADAVADMPEAGRLHGQS